LSRTPMRHQFFFYKNKKKTYNIGWAMYEE